MSPARQAVLISALAGLAFLGLRSLPDTRCAFLHADHAPVVAGGVEFCGVDEEANFYSPKALKFPVRLEVGLAPDRVTGTMRLLGEDGRPIPAHEIAVSHTRQVHLHLRQVTGRVGYVHVHPEPAEDGSWRFVLPDSFAADNPGGLIEAYVDFVRVRSAQVQLAETTVELATIKMATSPWKSRNVVKSVTLSSTRTGESAWLRVALAAPPGTPPLKLQPLMGSLGHAVLFRVGKDQAGYLHMHPSLEGGEFAPDPTLSFRLRLPAPGRYDLWVHVADGAEDYLHVPLEVTP